MVKIYQGEDLIAVTEHEMGMYADLPRIVNTRASMAQNHRLKTSALMIAGLRGDPTSAALAGDQGIAVAKRMSRASPQLTTLVQARGRHLHEHLISNDGQKHVQVIVLGAGLDPKPLYFASPSQKWFLCDLRDMIKERLVRMQNIGLATSLHCVDVIADLKFSDWPLKLILSGFDRNASTLVIFEGVSMYLPMEELEHILSASFDLCLHAESRIWFDYVTNRLMSMDTPAVTSFLSSMARLGEPFVTAIDNPATISPAWKIVENLSASNVLNIKEPVYDEYRFVLLGHMG